MKDHRYIAALAIVLLGFCVTGIARAQTAWDTNSIAWEAPTTCTSGQPIANCPVTSYRVERAATSAGAFATLGTSTVTTYTHLSAAAGVNCYRVIAIAATGESVPSNVACKTNTQPSGPPNPPTNLRVVATTAYNVRPDYQHFAFLRGTRVGTVKLGSTCDGDRVTADGYNVVSRLTQVSPRPAAGTVVVAKCA